MCPVEFQVTEHEQIISISFSEQHLNMINYIPLSATAKSSFNFLNKNHQWLVYFNH